MRHMLQYTFNMILDICHVFDCLLVNFIILMPPKRIMGSVVV